VPVFNEDFAEPLSSRHPDETPEVGMDAVRPEDIPREGNITADDTQPVLVKRDAGAEFAFNGFCPVTLVKRGGLLLPGDVVLGQVGAEL
jgi:hypothetical protein